LKNLVQETEKNRE